MAQLPQFILFWRQKKIGILVLELLDSLPRAATSIADMTQNEPTDAELVRRTLAGDRDAFSCLYDRYARLLRAVIFARLLDGSAVPDLVQESFLRAYRKLHTLREPAHFRAWLAGIGRQVTRERNRSWRRERHKFAGDFVPTISAGDDRPNAIDDAEEIDWVLANLSLLEDRERLAVVVFYFEDRDAAQAAELLGLSRSGMYALVARAVARLAQRVQGQDSKDNLR